VILIAYDGSADSRAAIEQAAKLFPGQPATVLTVWQRFIDTMAKAGGGIDVVVDYEKIDNDAQKGAQSKATEGAELAAARGLEASGRTAVIDSTVADAILNAAAAIGADTIVLGSRGLTGIKSLILGSVSHAVLQHADRTVVVVPSPEVAKDRAEHRASR
jgi:nucleotide-binding universal stress UspA family protein